MRETVVRHQFIYTALLSPMRFGPFMGRHRPQGCMVLDTDRSTLWVFEPVLPIRCFGSFQIIPNAISLCAPATSRLLHLRRASSTPSPVPRHWSAPHNLVGDGGKSSMSWSSRVAIPVPSFSSSVAHRPPPVTPCRARRPRHPPQHHRLDLGPRCPSAF